MGSPRDHRLQLDVSRKAKRNLRILAEIDERSMGFMLDRILSEHSSTLAAEMFGGNPDQWQREFFDQPDAETIKEGA